jgi:hypothetical protein
VGTPIRITHRVYVKHEDLISPHYYVIQYQSGLKIKLGKPFKIRLCTGGAVTILQCRTPILIDEDDLKYGVRDNTSGSLVFSRSKGGGAG